MSATAARRICVTGATGKAGRAAVAHLREHGYDVLATDVAVRDARAEGVLLGYEPRHSRRDEIQDQ